MDPKEKEKDIEKLVSNDFNKQNVINHCFSTGGLLHNQARKVLWPKMFDIKLNQDFELIQDDIIKSHKDYNQVLLDVNRMKSLVSPSTTDDEYEVIKQNVTSIVMNVLAKNKSLHYYQGFHDICYIFYLVLGTKLSIQLMDRLVEIKFKKFMEENMDSTAEYLNIIYVLLKYVNPALLFKIEEIGVESTFAISWVITWFTHVLQDITDIIRLYDIFLADESSLICIYSCVAIMMISITDFRDDLTDFDEIFVCLTQMPKKCSVESIVRETLKLYQRIPPQKLKSDSDFHLKYFLRNQKNSKIAQIVRRRITYAGRFGYYIYRYNLSEHVENVSKHPYMVAFGLGVICVTVPFLKSYISGF